MIIFPPCKINIGLQVLRRRKDGFHDIATIFYPLPLQDVLEIVASEEEKVSFRATGIPIPGKPEDNLCVRAYHLLRQDFPALPPVHIYLHKVVPIGAGLGGGSSDGAAMLKLLDAKFRLGMTEAARSAYALALGSDCAFFLRDGPCYATGRGETLEPLGMEALRDCRVTLVCPDVPVSTAWAYGQVTPALRSGSLPELVQGPVEAWKGNVVNDFEEPVFRAHPALREIRDRLYEAGALYASLSGTGSAVYGIFPGHAAPVPADAFGNAQVFRF